MAGQDALQRIGVCLETSVKCIVPAGITLEDEILVGVSSGAFDGETAWCLEEGIQVLVTGEVKHSDALDLADMPFVTVSSGHYETEIWVASLLAEQLGDIAKSSIRERAPLKFI
jgi:putative NIF3 family GTP cyclohydrolase 1 type 2